MAPRQVVMLVANETNPTNLRNAERLRTLFFAKRIVWEEIDGTDPSNKEKRGALFGISILPFQYPQVFFMDSESGEYRFIGNYNRVSTLNENAEMLRENPEILANHPDLADEVFDKVFAEVMHRRESFETLSTINPASDDSVVDDQELDALERKLSASAAMMELSAAALALSASAAALESSCAGPADDAAAVSPPLAEVLDWPLIEANVEESLTQSPASGAEQAIEEEPTEAEQISMPAVSASSPQSIVKYNSLTSRGLTDIEVEMSFPIRPSVGTWLMWISNDADVEKSMHQPLLREEQEEVVEKGAAEEEEEEQVPEPACEKPQSFLLRPQRLRKRDRLKRRLKKIFGFECLAGRSEKEIVTNETLVVLQTTQTLSPPMNP